MPDDDERVTHPVLAADSVHIRRADAVDGAGAQESVMMVTFGGHTVVDGQRLADTETRVAIPCDQFVGIVMHLGQAAARVGLVAPLPFQQCPEQLLMTDDDGQPAGLHRCGREQHAFGRHIDEHGVAWSDEQADAVCLEFDRE